MNLINIINGVKHYEFQVNQLKYIICNNNHDYLIYNSFRQFASKEKSEYRDENHLMAKILIDDQELSLKNNLFIEITDTYSLNEDKKLNAKSLMLKYLEIKLQHTDLFDTIGTIDILFQTLADEMNESSILKVMNQSMGYKQLLKMIIPYYGDEFQKDEYDLSWMEIMEFQIQLIQYISLNNTKFDHIIVYGRMNSIGEHLIQLLKSLANCKVVLFTNQYHKAMELDDICLFEYDLIDLANREEFYHLFSEHSFRCYTIKEVQEMIIAYLNTNYTRQDHDIYQELEHFSNL